MSLRSVGVLDVLGHYNLNGVILAYSTSSYNLLHRRDGGIGIYLGGADAANYYDNTGHFFRDRAGSNYMSVSGSGFLVNVAATFGVSVTAPRFTDSNTGANIPPTIVSTSAPSGSAPNGAVWIQVVA